MENSQLFSILTCNLPVCDNILGHQDNTSLRHLLFDTWTSAENQHDYLVSGSRKLSKPKCQIDAAASSSPAQMIGIQAETGEKEDASIKETWFNGK